MSEGELGLGMYDVQGEGDEVGPRTVRSNASCAMLRQTQGLRKVVVLGTLKYGER